MRTWKWLAALLLVISALTAATLACNVEDALFGMATPTPFPTSWLDAIQATGMANMLTNMPTLAVPIPPSIANLGAAYSSNPNQLTTLYASGFAPTTPFSQLFGNMDQVETIQSLKSAIPDLKVTPRMSIVQGDWEAVSFDISGTFTQPLVTANGDAPTDQPTLVHDGADAYPHQCRRKN